MSRPDLEVIRRRLAAATPGPWEKIARQDEPPEWYTCTESGFPTARIGAVDFPGTEADADLIAHAPTDLAALAAHVERLEGLLTQAWDKLPEGYTVLRGQILQAQGYRGCTWCGMICVDHEAEVAAVAAELAV